MDMLKRITIVLLGLLLVSCTFGLNTDKDEEAANKPQYFPSCYEGTLNSPRGDMYNMFATIDNSARRIYLLVDTYSIPSGAELKPQCNMIESTNAQGLPALLNMFTNYTPSPGEPANPCRNEPVSTVANHDWINNDNQVDEAIMLVYRIDSSVTAWQKESDTKGWDGVVKGTLVNIESIRNVNGQLAFDMREATYAIWERQFFLDYAATYNNGGSVDFIKAFANFPRILNYLKTIKLGLWFGRPGGRSNQPQVLQGDFSLEPEVAFTTYKNGQSTPYNFRSTGPKSHVYLTDDSNEGHEYNLGPHFQMPAIRGTTNGLARCENYYSESKMSRIRTGNIRSNSKIRRTPSYYNRKPKQ